MICVFEQWRWAKIDKYFRSLPAPLTQTRCCGQLTH
jgi:hypothetical protein